MLAARLKLAEVEDSNGLGYARVSEGHSKCEASRRRAFSVEVVAMY